MKKLKFLFFPTILVLVFGLMLSCAKSSEDNINDGVANLGNTLGGGGSSGSGGGSSGSGGGSSDEAPNNVVFSKTILDPDAKWSRDYEESASDVIKTSGGDYVVVGTSISWEWPMPNNMDDILIVKLDGTSGNVIWNKKIHLRNFDRATSVVEDNDGNYVLTGFTSSNDTNKSDVFFGKVDPQGNVLTKNAIKIR